MRLKVELQRTKRKFQNQMEDLGGDTTLIK